MQRIDFHYAFVWPKRVDNLSRFLAETVAGHDYVVGDGLGKMLKYLAGKQIRFPGGPAWPFSIAPKWLADHPCVSEYFVAMIATGHVVKTKEEMSSQLTYRPALDAGEEVIGALVWWAAEPERMPRRADFGGPEQWEAVFGGLTSSEYAALKAPLPRFHPWAANSTAPSSPSARPAFLIL